MNNFKHMTFLCMQQLTNFPYIEEDFDALTNYELLCKVVEYLNKVIANENLQNDAINTLATNFNNLKDYVDNYFDNLDVQDEINNKLDDMASDGTLEEIISSYLNTKSLLVFDTVDDMKASTNLVSGSYAKTLGYYEKGDKGGYIYKIRETELSDATVYQNIILNDDSLCAELILENNYITPEMFGAYGDFTTDDSLAIQRAYDYATLNGYTLYFQKNYFMQTGIKVKSQLTRGDENNNLINITGNANPEWTFSARTDRTSHIKVNDHFISTDVTVNTGNANTLAKMSCDIGYLTIDSNDTTADFYLFNAIVFDNSTIHHLTTRGFAGVLYGGLYRVTHVQNNYFLSCHGICFKSFETVITLFTDSYVHDNYINGGSSSTHGNLFAYGNAHNGYIYNNYIDFFNYIYKCLPSQSDFSRLHSNNNTYDTFISMNAKRDGTHAWNDTFTGFRDCIFMNDRFVSNQGSYAGYLPDEQRTIFDMSSYTTNGLSIIGCEITDSNPVLFYSSQAIYYPNADSANRKRVFVKEIQCDAAIQNKFSQLIQCSPSNERGTFTVFTDMIDMVESLPQGTQFNGRRVIYDGNVYEYFGGWKTFYNV